MATAGGVPPAAGVPAGSPPELPCPGVRFADDFVRRLELFAVRLAGARERREGTGPSGLATGGEEFVGYRPYRPGEDLRRLDWSLLARLDRAFVRVTRREAGERWAVVLDTSASMGVGPPGKLQHAAEICAALATVGARFGAVTSVHVTADERAFVFRKRADLPHLISFLSALEARGGAGLAGFGPRRVAEAGRVFLLGDLDGEPAERLAFLRRGRALACSFSLAPAELVPGLGPVEWVDPEQPGGGARVAVDVDRALLARYEERLAARLEALRTALVRHGVACVVRETTAPFERVVEALLEGRS